MPRHSAQLTPVTTDGPLGPLGEDLAVAHLTADDALEVVARNWRVGSGAVRGELDVVALDHARSTVVVAEVKARRSDRHGGPLAAVTPRKQARIRSLTALFLREAALPYRRVRLDVVAVWLPSGGGGRLEHLEGAF